MKYWPLKTNSKAKRLAYLFLDDRGLGTLHVERPEALDAMRQLQRGELPEGATLIPNHQLLRIQSCHASCTLTARMHRNKVRRFRLQTVTARDEVIDVLKEHPAVREASVQRTPLIRHAAPQLGGITILLALGYMSYRTALTTSSGEEMISELSLVGEASDLLPLMPYLLAGILLLVAIFAIWRRPEQSREVDEVLFE